MLKVRPHTKSGGGGGAQSTSVPIRKVRGGGGGSPIYEKCVCGGGAIRFRSDTFVWHTEDIYMYLPRTRARMNLKYMPAKVNL